MDAADWFHGWAELHCYTVGAGPDARDLFDAERHLFLGVWNATQAELGACTAALATRPPPPDAREAVDAVGRQLARLRDGSPVAPPATRPPPPGCPACGGEGVATIPHRNSVWQRRVIVPKGYRVPLCTAAICDRAGCEAGRAVQDRDKSGMLRLSTAEKFHGCDLVALWRGYEREQLERARRLPDFGPPGAGGAWAQLCRAIIARAVDLREDAA